jgi:hypothetical protein
VAFSGDGAGRELGHLSSSQDPVSKDGDTAKRAYAMDEEDEEVWAYVEIRPRESKGSSDDDDDKSLVRVSRGIWATLLQDSHSEVDCDPTEAEV